MRPSSLASSPPCVSCECSAGMKHCVSGHSMSSPPRSGVQTAAAQQPVRAQAPARSPGGQRSSPTAASTGCPRGRSSATPSWSGRSSCRGGWARGWMASRPASAPAPATPSLGPLSSCLGGVCKFQMCPAFVVEGSESETPTGGWGHSPVLVWTAQREWAAAILERRGLGGTSGGKVKGAPLLCCARVHRSAGSRRSVPLQEQQPPQPQLLTELNTHC